MHEIADRLIAAAAAGRPIAVATAISVEGSAPRTVGTSMAYDGTTVIGSIAGGCVEGAVVDACEEVLAGGDARTVEYGVDDETAFGVGLTCGGQLRIHVQLLTSEMLAALSQSRPVEVCHEFTDEAPIARHMIIVGAMEFSAALSSAARMLGYRVTVCDPRPLFATPARFAGAKVVVQWPTTFLAATPIDSDTVICVLSHDWRFDTEVLALALESAAGYVGAMGSRTTHDRRVASLLERGVGEEAIARLNSPIGLDIGASTPEETAISILAEVLAARNHSSTRRLTDTWGAIHPARAENAELAPTPRR